MATDDVLAEGLADLPESSKAARWSRTYRDYTPEVEMLSAVFDRIGELIRVVAATSGSRSKQPQLAPRPESALERVRRRMAQDKHKKLSDRLLGRG